MSKMKRVSAQSNLTENSSFHEITNAISEFEKGQTALGVVEDAADLSQADQYTLVASRVLTGDDVCTTIYKLSNSTYITANNNANQEGFSAKVTLIKSLLQTTDNDLNSRIDQLANDLVQNNARVYTLAGQNTPNIDLIKSDLRFLGEIFIYTIDL